ncbi:unnamed protein product [Vitrella brassicaformis CCMP3155]|uniref:Amino acid transporter transmembrane domain-containing protein n=1 Tax=Vitrella brassicaformis (strain CCMP3155) TaxID=1169540 RepID=A0A0G4FT42_VITBC|nr:unnamed protein product [Vitrella brassicaformis CCMP3155]|mmetsp:Transcript_23820/g.68480  ORF Transcript_23820/g.68480 Transcript_23820/m.68480 type:complete len:432 (-) Transcript_23820:302-1597(-)|eukprot:CEM17853.1 unnamed protein product [Vitrella brassicaformis CCMP3155]
MKSGSVNATIDEESQEARPLSGKDGFVPGIAEALSPLGAVSTLLVAMIGTGVVAMPFIFLLCGITLGVIGLAAMAWLAQLAMVCIIRSVQISRCVSYEDLGERAFGMWFSRITDLSLIGLLLGSTAAYIIIATNILSVSLPDSLSVPRPTLFALVALAMFPVCLARTYDGLAAINTFCFTSFVVISVICTVKSVLVREHIQVDETTQRISPIIGLILSLPMTSTYMNGHMNVPQVYAELRPQWKRRAIPLGTAVCVIAFAFYVFAGMVPYLVFHASTETDILTQLVNTFMAVHSARDPHLSLAQVLLGLCIVLKTPVIQFPLRSLVLGRFQPDAKLATLPMPQNLLLTAVCIAAAYLLAVALPRLDLVIQIVGATSGVFLVYICPGAFTLGIERRKAADVWVAVRGWTLVVSGLCISVTALCAVIVNEVFS